jgi:hypothetical protein
MEERVFAALIALGDIAVVVFGGMLMKNSK